MVKRGIGPQNGVVTGFASCRERGRNVIHRRGRVVVIRLVARDASSAGQIVIIVDVAVRTGSRRHGVTAREWEPGSAVVKRGIEPGAGSVALVTGLREIRADVIGIRRSLEVLQVARNAGVRGQIVIVVDVAIGASTRRHRVQPSEREASAVVIKRGVEPSAGAVALVAGLREIRADVIGIRRSLVVLQVTTHASGAIEAVVVVDVAIGALPRRNRVQAGEREAGAGVVESRVQPVRGVVTLVAGLREIGSDVIRTGRSLVILQVAAHAGAGVEIVVIVDVAVGAGARRDCVQAGQDKAGSGVVKGCVSPLHGVVALLTGRREARMGDRRGGVVEIGLVATDARRNRDAVVVVDVTIGALARRHHMRASEREARLGVIESCGLPSRGVVARIAGLRESAGNVVGTRGSLEILKVTRNAGGRSQAVVVVDVAVNASPRRDGVRAREREVDAAVVEAGRCPACSCMARFASLRKPARDVVGIRGPLEVFQVARHAGRLIQSVVIVNVAIGAGSRRHCVQSGQRESGAVVVECRVQPTAGGVAGFASLRKSAGNVVGIRGSLEILEVARHASSVVQSVVAVDVAIGALAWRHRVQAGQGKSGGGVIKLAVGPLHHVMALLTGCGETGVRHRSCSAGEIFLVTREARRAGQVVIVVDVAIDALAGRIRVPPSQKEPGRAVIKLGIQPVVGGVTAIARRGELGRNVVRVGSVLKVRLVAGEARRGHDLELAVGATLVAGITVDGCVGTGQRETIVVLLHIFNSDVPSADGVALLAIRAQLTPVNIGVAILAALTDAGENHLHVTLDASDAGVHTAQRIARLVVVELRNCSDRLPAIRSVAVLARDGETAVRTSRSFGALRSSASRQRGKREHDNEN